GGIQKNGTLSYSEKAHKPQIGEAISEIIFSERGSALAKSLEVDLSNYISGGEALGALSKRILKENKNIIVV
ncbi:MAG: hypothetical protein OEL54_03665, partial [Flavobacteriaceae bacterium]|nr:hypothetical protein [Flavobacteriaceae bacterium]